MPDEPHGFGESNAPERAGSIVRDHVRAVIESAEGNAAEIRRRAREDADALDRARADSASRLTNQIGELEGSFTDFGERLGKEMLPSGEIKGELGTAPEQRQEAPTGEAASAWRAPPSPEPASEQGAPEEGDEAEGSGLLGGIRKRFGGPAEESPPAGAAAPEASPQETSGLDAVPDEAGPAPPEPAETPSSWLPDDAREVEAGEAAEGQEAWAADAEAGGEAAEQEAAAPSDEAQTWTPPPETQAGTPAEEQAGTPADETPARAVGDETEASVPADETDAPGTGDETQAAAAAPETQPGAAAPPGAPARPKPRGRIARLLLGRRPGE